MNEDQISDQASPLHKPFKRAFLSLGSNLGDRVANLSAAIECLAETGIEVRRVSSFYRTEPVGFSPQSWFVNCVVEVGTDLMPLQLLKTLKSVERAMGRRPAVAKGPRRIDIDILLYENVVVRSAELTIPHERMGERRFVLVPLRELAPNTRHPVTKQTVLEMLRETQEAGHVVRLKTEL